MLMELTTGSVGGGKLAMRILIALLTIISVLLSGVSADITGISSYYCQNQSQSGSPVDTHGVNMDVTSRDYLTSETPNYAILPAISSNNYTKLLRETPNKLFIAGLSLFRTNKDWTYLLHFVIPKSTFQNICHSIQPRAPNFIALV